MKKYFIRKRQEDILQDQLHLLHQLVKKAPSHSFIIEKEEHVAQEVFVQEESDMSEEDTSVYIPMITTGSASLNSIESSSGSIDDEDVSKLKKKRKFK